MTVVSSPSSTLCYSYRSPAQSPEGLEIVGVQIRFDSVDRWESWRLNLSFLPLLPGSRVAVVIQGIVLVAGSPLSSRTRCRCRGVMAAQSRVLWGPKWRQPYFRWGLLWEWRFRVSTFAFVSFPTLKGWRLVTENCRRERSKLCFRQVYVAAPYYVTKGDV